MKNALILPLLLAVGGCTVYPAIEHPTIVPLPAKKSFAEPLAPGELALEKVTDPAAWPDLATPITNRAALLDAIEQSLLYLAKPSSKTYYPYLDIEHDRVIRSLEAFRGLVEQRLPPHALEAALRSRFELYRSKGRRRTGERIGQRRRQRGSDP